MKYDEFMRIVYDVNSVGHAVRDMRQRLGWSKERLADEAEISDKCLDTIEANGKWTIRIVRRVLAVLMDQETEIRLKEECDEAPEEGETDGAVCAEQKPFGPCGARSVAVLRGGEELARKSVEVVEKSEQDRRSFGQSDPPY